MSPKLLIVGQLPPPHHGSNVMTNTFHSSLLKLGYKVSIVEKTLSKTIEEVDTFSLKKILRAQVIIFKIIWSLFAARADLCFYFISMKPPSIYFDLILLFLINFSGISVVLYVHGKGFEKIGLKMNPVARLLRDKILFRSIGAIVLGELLKEDISSIIPKERLFVLPNCVADIVGPKKKPVNKSKKNKTVKILYLSNLVPSKGAMEFLNMAKILTSYSNNFRFVLAGPAPCENFLNELKNFIKEERLTDFVDMPGPVYGAEKEALFHDSDIFVFPTFYELETFGLVNLEAMRSSLPVVSTNEGSIPEVVIDGKTGYIVDPQNAEQLSDRVLKLVNDEELRTEMGKAGRKIYEELYTTQAYVKRLNDGVKFFLELTGFDTSYKLF